MSFINTKEELKVGGRYQYQDESLTGFGDKEILDVELVEDKSTKENYCYVFRPLGEVPEDWELSPEGTFEVTMPRGNFYYPGMARIWDEDEYDF